MLVVYSIHRGVIQNHFQALQVDLPVAHLQVHLLIAGVDGDDAVLAAEAIVGESLGALIGDPVAVDHELVLVLAGR